MNILVIDDDSVSLKMLAMILQKHSHNVTTAVSAREAIAILQKQQDIDLIISDIMMPNIDGFALLRLLKTDRRLRRLPVILCTSMESTEAVLKARDLKVFGYIVKPVDARVLIEKVNLIEAQPDQVILVVDDEEMMRSLLAMTLKRDGWSVLTAGCVEEAIDLLRQNETMIVLSDIHMPGRDGFQLLSHIKENNPSMPVLLMSGRGEWHRDQVVAAGADDFIANPFRNTEILKCIDALLERTVRANSHGRR